MKSTAGRATYTFEDGIYRILPPGDLDAERKDAGANPPAAPGGSGLFGAPGAFAPPEAPKAPARKATIEILAPAQPGADVSMNLDVEGGDLYEALKLIFVKAKLNYTLDPSLRSLPITAHFTNAPLRVALELLLKSVDSAVPLTYRVENGVYKIVEKTKDNAEGVKP